MRLPLLMRSRWSFCQGTSTRKQRSDLFGLSSKTATSYYQSNYSKVETIQLIALSKETTSKRAGLSSHYPFLMLNVK